MTRLELTYNLRLPDTVTDLLDKLDVFSLNVGSLGLPLGCISLSTYYNREHHAAPRVALRLPHSRCVAFADGRQQRFRSKSPRSTCSLLGRFTARRLGSHLSDPPHNRWLRGFHASAQPAARRSVLLEAAAAPRAHQRSAPELDHLLLHLKFFYVFYEHIQKLGYRVV